MFQNSTTRCDVMRSISPAESTASPTHHSFRTTITLSKDASPEFYFENYANPQRFNSSDEYSIATADFKVERRLHGDSYVYEVQSNSAFQVRSEGAVHKIDSPNQVALPSAEPKTAALPLNEATWKDFAKKAQTLIESTKDAGNTELVTRLQVQLKELHALLEAGVDSRNLHLALSARDKLNQSLTQATLGISLIEVHPSAWNLQSQGYGFTLAANEDGTPPQTTFKLTGSLEKELREFSRPQQAEADDPRVWAIAKDESILVSRKRLDDGSYRFQVYLKQDFSGSLTLESGSGTSASFSIVSSSGFAGGSQVIKKENGTQASLQVPTKFIPVLPPLPNAAWEGFAKEIKQLETRLNSEGQSKLGKDISIAFRKLEEHTFRGLAGDSAELRSELERLLAHTALPPSERLVATGAMQQVLTNCGWQLTPVYERRAFPAYVPPRVPDSPPPRLHSLPTEPKLIFPLAPLKSEDKLSVTPTISKAAMEIIRKQLDEDTDREKRLKKDTGRDPGYDSRHRTVKAGPQGTSYQLCINPTESSGIFSAKFYGKIDGTYFDTTFTLGADGTVKDDYRCVSTDAGPKRKLVLTPTDGLKAEDASTNKQQLDESKDRMLRIIEQVILPPPPR